MEEKLSDTSYFCPECGWEGFEPICAICGGKAESLNIDPVTGRATDASTDDLLDDIEDIDGDWEDDEDDN